MEERGVSSSDMFGKLMQNRRLDVPVDSKFTDRRGFPFLASPSVSSCVARGFGRLCVFVDSLRSLSFARLVMSEAALYCFGGLGDGLASRVSFVSGFWRRLLSLILDWNYRLPQSVDV